MSMRFLLVLQSLWLLHAAETPPVETANSTTMAREARLECAAGNLERGIRLLAELWVTSRDPTWIYNQGRCYEQNAKNDLAAARFREYLRVAQSLPAEEIEAIRLRIEDLQPSPERSPVPRPSVSPEGGATPVPVPAAVSATQGTERGGLGDVASPTNPLTTVQPQTAAKKPLYARWWAWTAGAAVVVGATIAVVLLSTRDAPRSPGCDVGVICGD